MTSAAGLSLEQGSVWKRVWRPFWTLPAAVMLGSVALGVVLPVLDRELFGPNEWVFSGRPDAARSVLSTVAAAMISVTGLVFSVTMVVLQLASSQFSPRVLGKFLDARVAQVTLGVFAGSFLYSLTVLRVIRDESSQGPAFVPHVAVTLSYVYVLASVAMFLAFIAHITSMVQVSRVISDIGAATVAGLTAHEADESHSEDQSDAPPDDGGTTLHVNDRHGHVVAIDAARIIGLARDWGAVVRLDVGIGDFVVPGQRVGRVVGPDAGTLSERDLDTVVNCLSLERERSLALDPLFGTRQLVDIAERALSAGINDPTTATQVVRELHLVLRVLSTRPDPPGVLLDDDDKVRMAFRPQTFARHLALAVDELMAYAMDAEQVPGAIADMLDELADHALPSHREELDAARDRVRGLVERAGAAS